MAAWDVIESVVEYETPWYVGGYDLVEQPDGSTHRYYWADLPPAVIVVPRRGDDVVFVEQYRPTVGETFLELPAGIVEDGESFADAAGRELEEETGYAAGSIETLGSCWAATGVLRHERGFVAATELSAGTPNHGDNEFIDVRRVPADRAIDVVRSPPANDATLGALLLAKQDGFV